MRRPSIRVRLTLWYGGLFLLAGVLLLALNFALVARSLPIEHTEEIRRLIAARLGVSEETLLEAHPDALSALAQGRRDTPVSDSHVVQYGELFGAIAAELRRSTLDQLLIQSAAALLAVGALSVGIGWFMTGRMLRPVHAIASAARGISEENLETRIALGGPHDELRELADQFDAMLDRLQVAFDTQREFIAHASHELRTPLTIIKTELEVTLGNQEPTREELARLADVARRAIARTEKLIDHLLMLARAGEPLRRQDRVDLAEVAQRALEDREAEISACKLRVSTDLREAPVQGDPVLLDSLVTNLLDNAIRYNRDGGEVRLSTVEENGWVRVQLSNDGPAIPADQVERLFERFTRFEQSRSRATGGYGLGLAIVRAIARGHGGEVRGSARAEGGLVVSVRLPSVPPVADTAP
jgi:signal transduction histidine kinase